MDNKSDEVKMRRHNKTILTYEKGSSLMEKMEPFKKWGLTIEQEISTLNQSVTKLELLIGSDGQGKHYTARPCGGWHYHTVYKQCKDHKARKYDCTRRRCRYAFFSVRDEF